MQNIIFFFLTSTCEYLNHALSLFRNPHELSPEVKEVSLYPQHCPVPQAVARGCSTLEPRPPFPSHVSTRKRMVDPQCAVPLQSLCSVSS